MPKSSKLDGCLTLVEISNFASVRVRLSKHVPLTWNLMVKFNISKTLPLLLDLANLEDDGVGYFTKRHGWRFTPNDLLSILELRDELRQMWKSDDSLADVARRWLSGETRDTAARMSEREDATILFEPQTGVFLPSTENSRVFLLFTFLRFRSRLGCCENPSCHTYFIRTGRAQRFCDKPRCAAYAQRFYKLKWWQEHGSKWRAKRKKRGEKNSVRPHPQRR